MSISVVQVINNDGPNPGTTQQTNGMNTSATVTAGNSLVGVTTCATYGGAHQAWSVTDSFGNAFEEQANVMGGQGNLNTDQQMVLWLAALAKGGADVLHQYFKSGDNDYQALNFLELGGKVRVVGKAVGAAIGPAPAGVLTTPNGITVTAADVPCTMFAWVANISEISGNGNYTPQLHAGWTQVGDYWKFPGDNPQNLENLLVARLDITTPGTYFPQADAAISGEYWQVEGIVVTAQGAASGGGTPPPTVTTIALTQAQVATLAAGTSVNVTLAAAEPAGAVLTLTPPATSKPQPSPNDTVIKLGSAAVITDAAGNTWGISRSGQVTINGATDTTTANVVQIAYVSGAVWQENTANLWWEKTSPTAAWTPQAGTSVSPLPGSPPPPPPPNTTIKSPVFLNGKFYWGGDWSGIPINYAYPDAGVAGPGPVIKLPNNGQYEYWLPYPPQNSGGPASNGVNFPLGGLTHFTVAVKPPQAGLLLTMQLYEANGNTTDINVGNSVVITQGKYGPATPVPGQWNVYTIPLTDFVNPVPAWIYKFILDEQGANQSAGWEIDQCGFF